MKTRIFVRWFASVALLLPLCHVAANGQGDENPWGGSVPPQTQNLAYERHVIEGFAWPASVKPGETINFYTSVMDLLPQSPDGQIYDIKIFRSPDMDTVRYSFLNNQGRFYPLHDSDNAPIFPGDTSGRRPVDFKKGCRAQWDSTSVSFTIPNGWPSGLYFAQLIHQNAESEYNYIPFIVRALHPGTSSKILFKFDWSTLHAYNYWGGGSLYSWDQDPVTLTPDSVIALDRPMRRDYSRWTSYTAAFERTLRDSGYTMEYCNNIDLDSAGTDLGIQLLSQYQTLVIWMHDEYWSEPERTNTESFKGDHESGFHGNIARFTSNSRYWLIRWIGPSADKYTQLQCRKHNYPGNQHLPLDLWRRADTSVSPPRAAMPEAKFLGSQYETGWNDINSDSLTEQPPAILINPSHWIFRNTGLDSAQEFGLGLIQENRQRGLVSGEVDNLLTASADFPTLEVLAQRWVYSRADSGGIRQYRDILHQMVYYEDTSSNARVFAQGAQGGGWVYSIVIEPGTIDTNDVIRMKTITTNIISHFSGKKYLGKVWTADPENALEWRSDVELDGDTHIPTGKYLRVFSQSTVSIDSGVTFNIDGTLEINGSVTITGTGKVHIGATGTILLASGATLKIKTTVQTADSVTVSVPSATTLRIDTLGKAYFGIGSRINVSGTFIAQGTTASPILLTRATSNNDYWSGITLNEFASATLSHCNILHAQVGISANSVQPTISHCTFDSCKIGVSLFQSAGTITNSLFTHNIIKAIIIDGEYDYIEPSAVPLLTDNIVSSNTTGIYITNSAPILERNTIEDNVQYGIACIDNGNAFVSRNEIDAPGCNVLNSNGIANLFVDNSSPFLGYADERIDGIYGGYNSFGPEKHEYDVWAQNESAVIARKNYWSEYPPDEESSFHTSGYGFSTIDWELPLEDFGYHPAAAPYTITKTQGLLKGESSLLRGGIADSTLHAALNLRSQKKYAQAVSLMKQFIRESATNDLAPAVFIVLQQTLADYARFNRNPSLRTAFAGYRDSLLSATQSNRMRRILLNSTKNDLMQRKAWNQAIAVAEVISNQYPNTQLDEQALYTTVTANLFGLGNGQDAEQQYALMQQRFPESELTAVARLLLQGTANGSAATSPAVNKSLTIAGDVELQPSHFALHQNYPNPFNPSTTIAFDLPAAGFVSLKLFDILGREVLNLINEHRDAGYHQINISTTQLSSGVYFYRFETHGFASVKKMLAIK
ncbi:T9SS type A sorting domain-containing protein [Sphingobacteriales bacterium CHB3]|nr:T9SS type A sorting domain-containing protein [Sphingobacteriales bacterium CHB3]